MIRFILFSWLAFAGLLGSCEIFEDEIREWKNKENGVKCASCNTDSGDDSDTSVSVLTGTPNAKNISDLDLSKYRFVCQDGNNLALTEFREFLVISMVYTRCTNLKRCPKVAKQCYELRKVLREKEIENRVSIVLMTYDWKFDTPKRLREYAKNNQFRTGKGFSFLQSDQIGTRTFFDDLGVAVNYTRAGRVNLHRNQMFIVCQDGRVAKRYSIRWSNDDVARDLVALVAERSE